MRWSLATVARKLMVVSLGLMLVASAASAETVLTFAMRGGQNYADGVKAALEIFYQRYPDIKVEVIPNYGRDKFQTAVVAGAAPDIYAEGAQYIISHASSGLIQPLDELINEAKLNMKDFVPPNVDLARWQGKTYAIPWASDINFALFKNKDLLGQAGYDISKPINTVAELDEISKRLLRVNADGQMELAPFMPWKAGVPANGLLTMALAFGGGFWNDAAASFTTMNPRNVAALEWIVGYARRYHELGVWSQTSPSLATLISQNKLVFGFVYPSVALGVRDKYPDINFDLGPIPHVAGQGFENPVWVAGTELLLPVGSKHPKEAFKLMAFLCSDPEGNTRFATVASVFPSNLRSPYHRNAMNDPIARAFYQQASAARFSRPPIPNQDFWTSSLDKAVNAAIALTIPPVQALEEADRAIRLNHAETLKHLGL